MARRPFDPRERAGARPSTARGTSWTGPRSTSCRGRRRRRPPRLHRRAATARAADQPRGIRNVFEATVAAGAEARLHLVGRRLRLPRRQRSRSPRTSRARHRATPTPPRRPRSSVCCMRRSPMRPPTPTCSGRASSPGRRPRRCSTSFHIYASSARSRPPLLRLLRRLPVVKPVLPDHGVPFQLVHHDDVATAMVAGVLGRGRPGVYNLAGPGEVRRPTSPRRSAGTPSGFPGARSEVTANVAGRIPLLAVEAGWLEALRVPMLMDCTRARQQLGWRPAYDGRQTLHELVAARR